MVYMSQESWISESHKNHKNSDSNSAALHCQPVLRSVGNTLAALCPKCGMGRLRPVVIVNGFGNIIRFNVIAFNHKLAFDTS